MDAAAAFVGGLNAHARVPGGYAVVRSVDTMQLEDVQPSYFLAETCKYLFLIADPSFLQARPRLNTIICYLSISISSLDAMPCVPVAVQGQRNYG